MSLSPIGKSDKDGVTVNFPKANLIFKPTGIFLFLIFALGFFLRIINISNFNIYPDSYIYLLMTKNIVEHSPIGYLGPNGMFYELQFSWVTRLGYPLLIIPFNVILHNLEFSAHAVSFLAAILSIPLTYLLLTKLFDSKGVGIVASFLLAISFTHIAWSGFVMAETTAIFFILLSLIFAVYSIKRETPDFGNLYDILAGVFAALAIITRSEYFLLIFPMLFLVVASSKHYWGRVLTFLSSLFGLLTVISIATPFIREQFSTIPNVLKSQSGLFVPLLLLSLVLIILFKNKGVGSKKILAALRKITALSILCFFTYIYLQLILKFLGKTLLPWNERLTATRIFAQYDFLIVIAGMLGLIYLLLNQEHSHIGFFALLYIVPLAIIYNHVNPLSYRYSTHHLPILVIAGSFFTVKLAELIKRKLQNTRPKVSLSAVSLILLLAISVSFFQIKISAASMAGWLSEVSYEKKAAIKVAKIIKDKNIPQDTVLMTFFVEPYYIYTNKSTGSVYPEYPYIPLNDFPSNKPILIIVDEALRDQRPDFTEFVKKNLSSFVIDKFWVGTPYYLKNYRKEESEPVTLYYMSGEKFTNILSHKSRKN